MHRNEIGRQIGSLVGVTGLFAVSSAAVGNFDALLTFLGVIGTTLVVLLAVVGGSWAGDKAQAFLTGRYFDLAFSKVAQQTEVFPVPQDPYVAAPDNQATPINR